MKASSTEKSIPGPQALPMLGWRAGMFKLYSEPFRYLRSLHNTYGNIVALAKGDPSYVCAFGPEANFALLSQPDIFAVSAGPFEKLPEDTPLVRIGGNSLQMMREEQHKQQRHLLQPALHRQQIGNYRDYMVALTEHMLEHWQRLTELELYYEMEILTRNIVVKALFGIEDEAEIEQLGKLLQQTVSSLTLALLAPIDIPGLPYHRSMHMAGELENALLALIERKRRQAEANDLLAMLIRTSDEDGARLSDKQLISHTFTLFTAGHETTSTALTWSIFLLGQHPQIFADLLDELEATLHGEAPTLEQLGQLPQLDRVIKESLRLMGPATIGQRRVIAPSYELGGYTLPRDATVIYSQFITHRMPELYAEPERFLPERWSTLKRTAYEYLPFGAGQHRCIGADFAMQEMKVVLSMILQRFRLEYLPGKPLAIDLTMRPRHGLPMRIRPQDRQFRRIPVEGMIAELVDLRS
ncbi:cytochrome P450 [Ktedonosporobacter rubrisoli]|uniref:Cytochrome P450 n=1 Tax=Ktedonosporobacter rubrisoli TaxID=2509675 RepID=A0A4P6JW01_KTERU|nr:cytochrome P450 [Ktedonosporobacter rubrisoli]QBD79859.1 cytochrome P450 [Ktedonosporobacter rubrisoli]